MRGSLGLPEPQAGAAAAAPPSAAVRAWPVLVSVWAERLAELAEVAVSGHDHYKQV